MKTFEAYGVWTSRRLAMAAIALVLLTVATRAPLLRLDRPIDDEVVYGVAAQTIVDGGVPYVSAVERKPPLLFYVYAGVLRTFGSYNWHALHAVELVWILGTMLGLYAFTRRLFNESAGLIAALLYSIFQAWSYWNNLAFNGEVLMNLPIAWACVFAAAHDDRRRLFNLFAAGALIATGFLLKQPAAIVLLPISIYVVARRHENSGHYFDRESIGQLTSLSLGFATVLLAATIWLLNRGLLAEAFYWTVTDHTVPLIDWGSGIRNTAAFIAFCLPITAGALLSCMNSDIWRDCRAERNLLIALAGVSLVGAYSTGRFFPHYFIALVLPCALLTAPWLDRLWHAEARSQRMAHASQIWLAATVVVFTVVHVRGLDLQPPVSEAGQYLRDHSAPGDRIFVWGQSTRIYLDAHRKPASRYIATFPLTGLIFGSPDPRPGDPPIDTRTRIVPGAWDHLHADFTAHAPLYIVDTEASDHARYPVREFPVLAELLDKAYRPVAQTTDGVIYKRDPSKTQLAFLLTP